MVRVILQAFPYDEGGFMLRDCASLDLERFTRLSIVTGVHLPYPMAYHTAKGVVGSSRTNGFERNPVFRPCTICEKWKKYFDKLSYLVVCTFA